MVRTTAEHPVKKQRLHDQITRCLALEILEGKFHKTSDGISSEMDLCHRLKVSRTVLRESIKVLAAKGLLELRPRVGIRIKRREDWNLLDPDVLAWQGEVGLDDRFVRNLCEVRLIVETAAAELAATRATAEDLRLIREANDEAERVADNKAAANEVDIRFHSAIFRASHNELLQQMSSTIGMALRSTQRITEHLPSSIGLSLHKAVADAVCRREGDGARAAMKALVLEAAQTLYGVLHPDQPQRWNSLEPRVFVEESHRNYPG